MRLPIALAVVGIRIASPVRFSSVTAVTALATADAMLFCLHGPRRSLPVARACSPLRPLRRCPFQNMKRARQEFVQASRGQVFEVAGRLPSHEPAATVASGSSACSVSQRTTMYGEHAYDPLAGCWLLMANEPLWSWRWWWWWPLMPNLAGPWTGRVSEASEAIIKPRSLAAPQAPSKPP